MTIRNSLFFLLISLISGLVAALMVNSMKGPPPSLPAQSVSIHPKTGPASYADAVSRAGPSVVNIYAAKLTRARAPLIFEDPVLQRFFGELLSEGSRDRLDTSLGSGVIVQSDGYVLTNYHIIEGADQIRVVLADGRNLDSEIIGSDPETDVAVLKLAGGDQLPAVSIGDAAGLRVGDVALAIGNPFGVGQTVTMGIISATGRHQLGISTFENFIQTDAAINPGNSGGALINAHGKLIGINTAIFSSSGGSHGIGFAIPVDLAIGVMQQLVQHGEVVRGWLGVTGQTITKALAESFALPTSTGMLIAEVLKNGPAQKAGLRAGDVITHINRYQVQDIQRVLELISNVPPGTEVVIEGWRGGDPLELKAMVAQRPRPKENP